MVMLAALFAVVQRRWTNTDASESEIAGFAHTLFFRKAVFSIVTLLNWF